ncbi:MAG: PHP domain-containing protein [Candidatus Thorarchaeota archaeon]
MTEAFRYDLHIHSNFSDGAMSVEEIVEQADRRKLHTIAITDHFWPSIGSTKGGINLIEQRRQIIEDQRRAYPHIRVLDGAEVDIQSDGSLAPVAGGIEQFELIIGSMHFTCNSKIWASIMERAAVKNRFDILGHWDGYLMNYNDEDGYRVAKALAENNIAVELSLRYEVMHPRFIDTAKGAGCKFTLGSDSHRIGTVGQLTEQVRLVQALELPMREF